MKPQAKKLTGNDEARVVSLMGRGKFNNEVKRHILSGTERSEASGVVVRKKMNEIGR